MSKAWQRRKAAQVRARKLPQAELAALAAETLTGAVDEVKASMTPISVAAEIKPSGAVAVAVQPTPTPAGATTPAVAASSPDAAPAPSPQADIPPSAMGSGPAFVLRPVVAGPVAPAPAAIPTDEATATALGAAEAATPVSEPPKALARREAEEVARCSPERARELTRSLVKHTMRGGVTVILRKKTKPHGFGLLDTWRFCPYPTEAEIEPIYQKVPPELEAFIRRHPEWFAIPELVIDIVDYAERAAEVLEERMAQALERRERIKAAAKARADAAQEGGGLLPSGPRAGARIQDNHNRSAGADDGTPAKVIPLTSNPAHTDGGAPVRS